MDRRLATVFPALPPVEGRLANLILWIRAHSHAISESTRHWANEVGAPASFVLPYFSRGGNFASLRTKMERSFPNGPTLPDLTLDLVTFLSIKLRRRRLGDLDSLRKTFGAKQTRLDDYYRTVRLILRVATIHAPDAVVPLNERSLRQTDGVSPGSRIQPGVVATSRVAWTDVAFLDIRQSRQALREFGRLDAPNAHAARLRDSVFSTTVPASIPTPCPEIADVRRTGDRRCRR